VLKVGGGAVVSPLDTLLPPSPLLLLSRARARTALGPAVAGRDGEVGGGGGGGDGRGDDDNAAGAASFFRGVREPPARYDYAIERAARGVIMVAAAAAAAAAPAAAGAAPTTAAHP
jgi:hypothetical protein